MSYNSALAVLATMKRSSAALSITSLKLREAEKERRKSGKILARLGAQLVPPSPTRKPVSKGQP